MTLEIRIFGHGPKVSSDNLICIPAGNPAAPALMERRYVPALGSSQTSTQQVYQWGYGASSILADIQEVSVISNLTELGVVTLKEKCNSM